jgi:hypothetical protein
VIFTVRLGEVTVALDHHRAVVGRLAATGADHDDARGVIGRRRGVTLLHLGRPVHRHHDVRSSAATVSMPSSANAKLSATSSRSRLPN